MAIKVDVAELAGVVVEGCLYGIFMVLYVLSIHILLSKSKNSLQSNLFTVIAGSIMAALATSQIVVDTVNIFWAFFGTTDREARIVLLLDVTRPIFAAKHSIFFTMMLVGDMIVTYRAFVVWGRNVWVVILPFLCSIGSAVCAYQTIYAVRHIATASIKAETSWGIAVFCLSLSANTLSTSLIGYKIWSSERRLRNAQVGGGRSSLISLLRILTETGIINAAYLLTFTIVLVSGSEAIEIMSCIATPLIGILFGALIIRAATSSPVASGGSRSYPMTLPLGNMQSHISTAVHVDVEWDGPAYGTNKALGLATDIKRVP